MIENRETAKLVSETIHRFRDEMRKIHPSVEATCTPEQFATYNRLSRILHHLDSDILQRLYVDHPDIRPKVGRYLVRGRVDERNRLVTPTIQNRSIIRSCFSTVFTGWFAMNIATGARSSAVMALGPCVPF